MSELVRALGPSGFGTYAVTWTSGGPELTLSQGQAEKLLIPGFVDIHIHGAFGIDLMSASSSELLQLCDLLALEGYEALLPTTITAPEEEVAAALKNLPNHEMIAGFHLEGPFISAKHPGAQPLVSIANAPIDDAWKWVLDHPGLRVATLAPEIPGGLDLVRKLVERRVHVSMGHSDATFEEAGAATQNGASHVTHTFNAMRGFHHREAGLAGFAMLDDRVYAELIYDRVHVSRPAAELLIRSKPANKIVAVSDSSMATRLPPGQTITMWGHECITSPGEVRLASNGALAGSAITLLDVFRNLYMDFGPEVAIRACCFNPRESIGLTSPPKTYLEFDEGLQLTRRRLV